MTNNTKVFLVLASVLLLAYCIADASVIIVQEDAAGWTEEYSQDFEGTDNCAADGVDFTDGSPDCQYTTESIGATGTESAFMDGYAQVGDEEIEWNDDFDVASGTVRVRFMFQIDDDDGVTTGRKSIVLFYEDDSTLFLQAAYRPSDSTIRISCTDENGDGSAIVLGTTYKGCIEYDLDNYDGAFYVDTTAGTYCAGATSTATCDDTVTTPTDIGRLRVQGSDVLDLIFDDMVVESQ